MNKEKLITGIDIGASKIRCLIGERTQKGIFNILGCGISEHNFLKKGVVVDLKGLSDAISKAVYKAEDQSEKKIHSVYVNISDSNLEGMPAHGEIIIADRDSEITHFDADKVTNVAKSINIPYEREIFYSEHHGYTLDGQKNITDPAGMFGFKLEADLYLITAKAAFTENLKKAVRQAGIGVADMIMSNIPTSMALLSEHEKKIGTVLIDIGADVVEIAIYTEGLLRFEKILPIGGNNITSTISHKFRFPEADAERIKYESGTLDGTFQKGDKIVLSIDSRKRTISKGDLQNTLTNCYKNMFSSIKNAAFKSQLFRDAANGVVLSGGASIMEGVAEMAEREFGCPVRVGHITELGRCSTPLSSHVYATAVGLVKYGFRQMDRKRGLLEKGPISIVSTFVNRVRTLYYDYF